MDMTEVETAMERIRKVMRLARRAATDGERSAALLAAKRIAEQSGVQIDDCDGDALDEVLVERDDKSSTANDCTEVRYSIQIIFRHFAVVVGFQPDIGRRTKIVWVGSRLNIGVAKYAFHIMLRESRKEWRKVDGIGLKRDAFMLGFFAMIERILEANPLRNDIENVRKEMGKVEERMKRMEQENEIRMKGKGRKMNDEDLAVQDSLARGFNAAKDVRLSRPVDGGAYEKMIA